MSWYTSRRRQRLPPDWEAIRQKVKARAYGRCEAERHALGCNGVGTDCDHIEAGDDDSLDNLQWLSNPCHKAKTARESAVRNATNAILKRHPVERNPGLLEVGRDSPPPGV